MWRAILISLLAASARDPIEVARGEAHRGPWLANDSDFRFVDDATVDLASDGDAVVAWVDQSKKDVFLQRFARDGSKRFTSAVNVSNNGATFSWLPRVVVDRDDPKDVALLWQEIIFSGGTHGGDILFARSTDGGRTFGPAANLSSSVAGDGKGRLTEKEWHNGSLALARAGETVLATWTEYEGALWVRRSVDRGKTFAPALRVDGSKERPARAPTIAVAKTSVYLAWSIGEDARADVRFALSTDGGKSFAAPRTLFPSDGHSDAPRLAVDRNGVVHLVYAESPKGPHRTYDVRYARLRGADFEQPRIVAGSSNARFAELAIDDGGAVHVAWDRYEGDSAYPTALMLATSRDGGESFTAARPVFSAPSKSFYGSQQGLSAKLAARDGVALVNNTFRRDDASWISLLRL